MLEPQRILQPAEANELAEIEGLIQAALNSAEDQLIRVKMLLVRVRNQKLYKEHYASLEDYAEQRWGISIRTLRRWLDEGKVALEFGVGEDNAAGPDTKGTRAPLPSQRAIARAKKPKALPSGEPTSQQGEDIDDGAGRDHPGNPAEEAPGAVATTREVAEATSESEPDTREQHPDPDQGAKTAGTPGQSVSLVAACKRILLADGEELALIGALVGEVVDHLRQHTFKAPKAKPSSAPKARPPALNRYSQPPPLDPAPRCKHERKKQRKGASGMVITECPDCNGVWR